MVCAHWQAMITSQLVIQMPKQFKVTASHDFSDLKCELLFQHVSTIPTGTAHCLSEVYYIWCNSSIAILSQHWVVRSYHYCMPLPACSRPFVSWLHQVELPAKDRHTLDEQIQYIATYSARGNKQYISNKYIRNVNTYLFKILVVCSIVDPPSIISRPFKGNNPRWKLHLL